VIPAVSSARALFDDEHRAYRESFRRFLAAEVVPSLDAWEAAGIVPRTLFARMAEAGFLSMAVPESYGGAGVDDFRFNVVLLEEAQRAGVGAPLIGPFLHTDVCLPYLLDATEEQRRRWLPGVASGTSICAVAMTEPDTGSDLAAIRTRARRDGDSYVLEGTKTFITNGINADLVIVAATCDPTAGRNGICLFVVERGMPGFERGRALDKIGLHALDTAELFFHDVRVPAANRLGEEGSGFSQLIARLARERLTVACSALAASETALLSTLDYVKESRAFGRTLGSYQHSRFSLADMRT
jgi:alkylation response protein AidB-like acyl-CoA dehydrogenase